MSSGVDRGWAALGLLAAGAAGAATPGLEVTIVATVDPDLRTVRGTLVAVGPAELQFADPLADQPLPSDDLTLQRTFPGAAHRGTLRWERTPEGLSFEARLPRRWGSLGATARGLFANGGWYPQPLVGGELPEVRWTVTVALPEGTTGALGDVVGPQSLRWEGTADRAPLAVVRGGVVATIDAGGHHLEVLAPHKPRRVLLRELGRELGRVPGPPLHALVVQAPLRRRLVEPGPGLAYLSDRAFRLTPPLALAHRVSVIRGVLTAASPHPGALDRGLQGAALSRAHKEALGGFRARQILKIGAWTPTIDQLLNNRRMPFFAEILEDTWPGDRLHDDLAEVYAPARPPLVILAQLEDQLGAEALAPVLVALAAGAPPREALGALGLEGDALDGWLSALDPEDWTLEVDRARDTVTVRRLADDSAPVEPGVVRIDGVPTTILSEGGPGEWTLPLGGARKVHLDPAHHLPQTTTVGDRWPRAPIWTVTGGVSSLNLRQFLITAAGQLSVRSRDGRNTGSVILLTQRERTVGLRLSYSHQHGPRIDGLTRAHRLIPAVEAAILNPNYASFDGIGVVGGSLTWRTDSRVDLLFPVRGLAFGASAGAGFVPGGTETWLSGSLGATGLLSPHPRFVVALSANLGAARTGIPHQLLDLGEWSGLRSLPAARFLATDRALGRVELRVVPLRDVGLPLGLLWGEDLQLSVGAEGTLARVSGDPVEALGIVVGVGATGEVLGAEPRLVGVSLGWPLLARGIGEVRTAVPTVLVRWGQDF